MLHIHGASFHIVAWRGNIKESVRGASQCSAHRTMSALSKRRPSTPEDVQRQNLYGASPTVWQNVKELVRSVGQAFAVKVEAVRSRTPSPLPRPPSDLFGNTSSSTPDSGPFSFDLHDGADVLMGCDEINYANELLGPFPRPPSRTPKGCVDIFPRRPQKTKLRERIRGTPGRMLRPVPESIVMTFRGDRLYDMF